VTTGVHRSLRGIFAAVAAAALLAGCGGGSKHEAVALAPVTKARGCRAQGALPDHACTPGAALAGVGTSQVCKRGYTATVAHVSAGLRAARFRAYGIAHHVPGQYELDRLVALGLGGSETRANLWPQAIRPSPGAREKDALESYLHAQVCHHGLPLKTAQQEDAGNWLATYHRVGSAALARYLKR
jgi:hypothetical protein